MKILSYYREQLFPSISTRSLTTLFYKPICLLFYKTIIWLVQILYIKNITRIISLDHQLLLRNKRHNLLIWQEFLQHPVAHIGSIDRKKILKKKHEETLYPFLHHAEPTYSCKRLNLCRQRFTGVLLARLFVIFLFECKRMNQIQKEEKNENRGNKIVKNKRITHEQRMDERE